MVANAIQLISGDRAKQGAIARLRAMHCLIHGENLHALRALTNSHAGKFKAIYIDPPYNNKKTYKHYDDNLGHEIWLEQLKDRLVEMWKLLRPDGSLWISIDDNEVHYLKVAADSLFGRQSFVTTIVWNHRTTRENRKVFSNNHEYILVYAKSPAAFAASRNLLPATATQLARYKNCDQDPRGPWQSVSANVQDGNGTPSQFYDFVTPSGRIVTLPKGRCWVYTMEKMRAEVLKGNIWFGKKGTGVPRIKKFLRNASVGLTPETLWHALDVGTTDSAKKQLIKDLPEESVFDTPKPEQLIGRILEIATNKGDLVLDAYAGSGTTGVVACKMGRRFVGIEQGSQAITHCLARCIKALNIGANDAKKHFEVIRFRPAVFTRREIKTKIGAETPVSR